MKLIKKCGAVTRRQSIRVLHVEDNPGDSVLLVEALFEIKGCAFSIANVATLKEALHRLEHFECDVILLDMSLPDSKGLDTLKRVNEAVADKPIIILTGSVDEETALQAVRYGAQDYLVKGRSDSNLIARTIRYAIERKSTQLALTHCAEYDALTGLANRNLFCDRLQLAITRADRRQSQLALLFIDLDGFKKINDELGHAAGDNFLKQTAQRLCECVRKQDTVARLGGDEFTVILEDLQDKMSPASLCQKIITALSVPYNLNNVEVNSGASIGVALYDKQQVSDADVLLKNADMAMYNAKKNGRNHYQFFSQEMNDALRGKLLMEKELRRAVERQEFFLEYQPQVNAKGEQLIGAEALLRWRHPNNGVVPPVLFIPVLERTGLIIPVGEWVLRTACQQWAEWIYESIVPADAVLSVNVSPQQFKQKNLVLTIADALQSAGLPARQLSLELTENVLLENSEDNIKLLSSIKDTGVQLSIDDFGTGYSSLNYLKHFPVDCLKVDRSFVSDIHKSKGDAAIAASIIGLAENLGLNVIAEGVDTVEKFDMLQGYGCQSFQGYLFGKPSAELLGCNALLAH